MKKVIRSSVIATMALALVAAFGAATASANTFNTTMGTATAEGSRTGANHLATFGVEQFSCSGSSFSGAMTNGTSQITTTWGLGPCTVAGAAGPVSWQSNGCKLRVNAGSGPALSGSVDIINCESPMSVTYQAYCKVEIGNQQGFGTVTYENVAGSPSTVKATASLSKIKYTRTGNYCNGPSGTHQNGMFSGQWTIKASSGGVQIPLSIESTPPPAPTGFVGEEAPMTLTGVHSVNQKRFFIGSNINCSNYGLSGVESAFSLGLLTLTPSYSGCTWSGTSIPDQNVSSGACSYVLHVNGEFDIAGTGCAGEPITITKPGCVLAIGPQSGLTMESTTPYTNEGSGKQRKISMNSGAIVGLTYSLSGASCTSQGTFTNGNIRSTILLSALNSSGEPQGLSVQ